MAQGTDSIAWIAVDWGTTRLRAWGMGDGIVARAQSDLGMARLAPDQFEPALLSLVAPWLGEKTPVIACGMVGARQGWVEAPYRPVPCAPMPDHLFPANAHEPRLRVGIIPGLRQDRPADVMRGEETQIAGFLAGHPDFDGVICLPGTHTKWVHISAGEVVSFQTFMTGEMFALLSTHSVLRHSIGAGWDGEAFLTEVDAALSRPERTATLLFRLRAEDLLQGLAPDTARARLSGALIGMELAAAKPYWLGRDVVVIGAEAAAHYVAALAAQGIAARAADAEAMTIAGLIRARQVAR